MTCSPAGIGYGCESIGCAGCCSLDVGSSINGVKARIDPVRTKNVNNEGNLSNLVSLWKAGKSRLTKLRNDKLFINCKAALRP